MTTSDQHADPQLTRRQLREIRMTGATAIVTPEAAAEALAQSVAAQAEAAASTDPQASVAPQEPVDVQAPTAPAAPSLHLPRAAEPIVEAPAPAADDSVDLGSRARTRRQARDQERIRTNSIPVVTPEEGIALPSLTDSTSSDPVSVVPEETEASPAVAEMPLFAPEVDVRADDVIEAPTFDAEQNGSALDAPVPTFDPSPAAAGEVESDDVSFDAEPEASISRDNLWAPRSATGATPIPMAEPTEESTAAEVTPTEPVVSESFGADLLNSAESFDDLLVRSSTSSGSAGSASMLILPEDMTLSPLTAPVTSTGQVILTGTFSLPEGLGSQGHAPGVADGKDVDAVLIDGELAPQSSPTPIAATAAVSQAKTPVEMIRPPSPEKSSKVVVALAITAGVLSLAAIGFTIYVVSTGKF